MRLFLAKTVPVTVPPCSVLLVDGFDSGPMYAEFLAAHGVTVWAAPTPEDALERLRTHTPDVIVTDMCFQKSAASGVTFIRGIRSRDALRQTPVIVVSGFVRTQDWLLARAAGATVYMVKPCLPDALLGVTTEVACAARRGEPIPWNWPELTPDRRRAERRAAFKPLP